MEGMRKSFCFARGFTLIEAMTFLFLFSIVSIVFLETYATGTRMIIESKNRLGATALSNQKMEIIRSIDYDAIGTTTGIPSGDIPENETVSVNTVKYSVHTFVQYVDDAYDGTLGGSPNDTTPNDYKRVKLTVSWGAGGADQSVSLFSNISPNGIETSAGGGVLSINVLDATGAGVPSATVHIVNSAASVNITAQTDATGNLLLPGAPVGTQNYELTVSKSGYYGVQTYPPYPTSSYNPTNVHASVALGVLNQKSIVMDQYVNLTVRSQDPFGTDIPNVDFTLEGGHAFGTAVPTGTIVYAYNENLTTDGSGEKVIADQSYGQYTFTESETGYELYKLDPESTTNNMLDATAGQSIPVTMILLDQNIGSVKFIVTNDSDTSPIAGASVRLQNITLGYDVTRTTDQYGFAYFPETLPALVNGTYDYEVSATGFQNDTGTVNLNGSLKTETIELTSS